MLNNYFNRSISVDTTTVQGRFLTSTPPILTPSTGGGATFRSISNNGPSSLTSYTSCSGGSGSRDSGTGEQGGGGLGINNLSISEDHEESIKANLCYCSSSVDKQHHIVDFADVEDMVFEVFR